ncbi:MAG: cobalamin-binding protein [Oxalobacter sp.]|nr:MAG: cobalamin-binding protein [Oxalobacter sp.]
MPFAFAATSVKDDLGNVVTVRQPANRVVTLAPHTMELVCAAGGCDRIVGKGSHSFYPPIARSIPEIGDNRQVDIERVAMLKPDLMVIWRHGLSQRTIDQLKRLGIPVFISDPRKLEDIPNNIARIGKLLGTSPHAQSEAKRLRMKLVQLKSRHSQGSIVRVFYQVSDRPLYTLNGEHIISEAIQLCGGVNVFADMKTLAPQINVEAVLHANPDVIIHTSVDEGSDGLAFWEKYQVLKAVRQHHLYSLNPDLLDRPGPRLVGGVRAMCEAIDKAR